MSTKLATCIALLLSIAAASPALACSCIRLTPEQAIEQADLVFEGTAVKVWQSKNSHSVAQNNVSFKVTRFIKGRFEGPSVIQTSISGAACGYGFEEGRSYRVHAHAHDGIYSTGLCSGNAPL